MKVKRYFLLIKELIGQNQEIYVAGGPVRDWLLGKPVTDIDIVFKKGTLLLARAFTERVSGAYVPLDEVNEVARVVVSGLSFDFSSFREGGQDIFEDLSKRDFTMNAMAISFDNVIERLDEVDGGIIVKDVSGLIDPFDGKRDIREGIIRAVEIENLRSDPLRMLRAFRFKALLDFEIEPGTLYFIRSNSSLIKHSSPERVDYELERIMGSKKAGAVFKAMKEATLLEEIIPEISIMDGVEQPGFHHLDVLGHLLEAICAMDMLVEEPGEKFLNSRPFLDWIKANKKKIPWLKWAAFMHDFGKPAKKGIREDGRVTFYEHDKEGARMVKALSKRLRWSKEKTKFISNLVRLHMRPFHLLNDLKRSGPTKRAMRRLLEETESDYPALFLLAMADSMAGCGPMKPKDLDERLSILFDRIHDFHEKSMKPVETNPPLLRGTDVMEILGILPGPKVGEALKFIREAQVEGLINTREEAIKLLKKDFEAALSKS